MRERFLAEDLKFELSILATVQGFYQKLMRDSLGGDVPIPSGLDEVALRHSEGDLRKLFRGCIAGCTCLTWPFRRQ